MNVDSRTNMLLIQDTPDSITNIRQLVAVLDIPVRQVEIEARIVVVNEDFSRDLGVRFGVTATESNGFERPVCGQRHGFGGRHHWWFGAGQPGEHGQCPIRSLCPVVPRHPAATT